ncbi:glycosyltransferase [Fictibacillus aquaticus]|uniref:Glycosyl transferase family 1 domain-containing protein n=1 Tax=Fictibacillus aquaticus TaxID=2021314 RepID=A0A235FBP5_9BACL|nr:glycosyltransferase [Fictibacillus aquaticus]OYD58746.1 hypothetical protein CGZ90_02270 [Fictibacillus aquaticus]
MNKTVKKIMFFTPYYSQSRGNSTTAKRIEAGLRQEGYHVSVFAYDESAWSASSQQMLDEADIVHILHFGRFMEWQQMYSVKLDKPYVITSGGTDVNHSLQSEDSGKYHDFLLNAVAVIVFSLDARQTLISVLPELEKKIKIIPQGVYLPDTGVSQTLELPAGSPRFLLPAGLRSVKDIFFAIRPLLQLRSEYKDLTLLIIGAKLDEDIYHRLTLIQKKLPWIHYHPAVELSQMPEVYKWSDVVINTSISEGQPTSLLEAMSFQKPVLGRNNGGNRSIIDHQENGFIFCDSDDFFHYAKVLLSNKNAAEQMGEKGEAYVKKHHDIQQEIFLYDKIYQTKGEQR